MLIHGGEITPYVQRMAQEILYTLWDLGLRVGHACRSLDDCLALARTDLPSRTSMQAARVLAGDQRLFRALQQTLRREVYRRDYPEFLAQMLAERDERYRRHGGSVYLQEPNVKESAGGLRDVHTALWLASARFGARTLRELEDKGHLTAKERTRRTRRSPSSGASGTSSTSWPARSRTSSSGGSRRRWRRASATQDDEVRLGVETFMRDYYRHARTIHRISARLIARCQEGLARHGTVGRRGRRAALADGLVVYDGRLHLAEPGALQVDPARILRVFWHAQQLGCELDVELERALEEAAPTLAEQAWRASPELRALFLSILRSWGRVATTLRRMHDTGVLGAYLPEFGALDCLVQYDHYHRYSVDQHSLLAVEVLEGLGPGQGAETDELAQILAEVERPELLMLGILLHDIGKALGHGHAPKGVPLIKAVTRRLNLDADDAAAVEFLVEHHLLLSHMAERRDIDDPKTVERLAAVARFPAWLTMLYVLTCTDIRAVGPGVWNAWRGALLRTLYLRTRTHLAGRFPKPPRRAVVAQRIVQALADPGYREAAEQHLQAMSDRYVRTTSPQRMAAHLRLIDRLREEAAVTEVFHFPDLGASDFVVVTRDTAGPLRPDRRDAGGARRQHPVRADRDAGRRRGPRHLPRQRPGRRRDPGREPLGGRHPATSAAPSRANARWRRSWPSGRPRRPGLVRPSTPGPARVTVDNSLSDTHTVVEVKAPDRLGLLYLVTRALAAEGLDIATAKIATDLDHALDTFYVTDRAGRKVEAPPALARLRETIAAALAGGDRVRCSGGIRPRSRGSRSPWPAPWSGSGSGPTSSPFLGLVSSVIAAVAFAADQRRAGALCLALAGALDILDGALARASGQVSPFGAFLDSVLDRYSDLLVLAGLVFLFARLGRLEVVVAVLLALIGTVMVSYTRARAESVDVECRVGLMERGERMLVLIAGALLRPPGPRDLGRRARGERDRGPPDRPHLAGDPRRPALIGTVRRPLLVHWARMLGGRSALAAVVVTGLLVALVAPRAGAAVVVSPSPLQRYREAHVALAGGEYARARALLRRAAPGLPARRLRGLLRGGGRAPGRRRGARRSRASGRSSSASRTPSCCPRRSSRPSTPRSGWACGPTPSARPGASWPARRRTRRRGGSWSGWPRRARRRDRWPRRSPTSGAAGSRRPRPPGARPRGRAWTTWRAASGAPRAAAHHRGALSPGAAPGGRGRAERRRSDCSRGSWPRGRSWPCATARWPGSRRCSGAWPGATRRSPGSTPP